MRCSYCWAQCECASHVCVKGCRLHLVAVSKPPQHLYTAPSPLYVLHMPAPTSPLCPARVAQSSSCPGQVCLANMFLSLTHNPLVMWRPRCLLVVTGIKNTKLATSASSIPITNNGCAPIQHASLCRLTSQVCHKRSWPPPWARCWPPCCPPWNSSWATSTSSQLGNLAPPHRQPKGSLPLQGHPSRPLLHLLPRCPH